MSFYGATNQPTQNGQFCTQYTNMAEGWQPINILEALLPRDALVPNFTRATKENRSSFIFFIFKKLVSQGSIPPELSNCHI